jgi:PAS domain S-box-containing protein
MKITARLSIVIISCSLAATVAVGVSSYKTASEELRKAAGKELVALRESRHATLTKYLESIEQDLRIISSSREVKDAILEFTAAYNVLGPSGQRALKQIYNSTNPNGTPKGGPNTQSPDMAGYVKTHDRYHKWFDLIRDVRGYYDVFLINTNGDLVYSVEKEPDFATNLQTGEWRRTGLDLVARGALDANPSPNRMFRDFEPYAPSKGTPASFVSTPIREGGKTIGVLAFQMPIEEINKIMQVTAGMGETGETYLVGADYLMRTDSRFLQDSTILKQKITSSSVTYGIADHNGLQVVEDYRGVSVLSAYQPIDFRGTRWVILSEIDMPEVLKPIESMQYMMLILGGFIAFFVAITGLIIANTMSRPLKRLNQVFRTFGVTRKVEQTPYLDRPDEIGDIARVFNEVTNDIGTYIAERKRAEAALAEKEAHLRLALDNMSDGLFVLDPDMRFALFNERYKEHMGVGRDLLYDGSSVFDLVLHLAESNAWGEGDPGELARARIEALANNQVVVSETVTANGRVMETRKTPIEGGGAVGVLTDITDRKRVETVLRESEQRLLSIFQESPVAVALIRTVENTVAFANERYKIMFGLSDDTVTERFSSEFFFDSADRDAMLRDFRRAGAIQDMELRFKRADGEPFWGLLSLVPFEYEGAPGRLAWIYDITERKRAESELQEKTNLVQLLHESAVSANQAQEVEDALKGCIDAVCAFNSWPVGHVYQRLPNAPDSLVPTGIWHLDEPERFADFRRATEELTFERGSGLPGRVLENGKPEWIVDLTQHPNLPRANLTDDTGIKAGLWVPVLVRDEVVAVMEFFATEALEPDDSLLSELDNVCAQIGRVIERKKAEREIEEARDAAEEATRAKASFLAAMSHEIRTPMGGVIGMIDLLQQTKLDDDQRHMTSTVRNSANSLLTIINDILDFSKIEAGKLDLEAIPISIRDCVEGVGEALAVNARNKNIGLSVFVDPDIPDAVLGDQVRVRQILFNLGGNAVKFTEEGKVLIRADRLPSDDDGLVTVRFEIIDDGIGIPEEAQANLFTAFSQVEASTTRRFGGTGLGLSICQRLTELMAGEIGVESEPDVGSTFHSTISFPVAKEHSIKSDGQDLGGLNVLLAIPDDDMRGLTPRYLEQWGAKVTGIAELGGAPENGLGCGG